MEPDNTIQKLSQALQEVHSEHELHLIITKSLEFLRSLYSQARTSFNEEHITFLQAVVNIDKAILSFIELKNSINHIDNMDDYNDSITELTNLYKVLRDFPVRKCVGKELRALRDKYNEIIKNRQKTITVNIQIKIAQMEQRPPSCPKGHTMVIREGENGYFWGCSHFPRCFYTKELSKKEREFLFS
jgi:hypothetical protein